MDAPLEGLASMHFALMYIDDDGKLRFETSPSIASDSQSILSPNVTDSFLKAVASSGSGSSISITDDIQGKSPLSPQSPDPSDWSQRSSIPELHRTKRKRVAHESVVPMSITCQQKAMLPVRNHSLLRRYYEKAFESLQQINCRILAKAYIKLVEPRKQVNFPYNGRKIIAGISQQFDPELTKPAWWPVGVTHREPDHLLKAERVRLLVHVLCELRHSHSITVDKLQEADQSIRRQILPAERLQVLDEIYRVREQEEKYLDGRSDAQPAVCVSRVNLPDTAEAQALGSPTTSSTFIKEPSNPVYRKEVPDMESHTSVFPSTAAAASSPTSSATNDSGRDSIADSSVAGSVRASWEPALPTSLPSLSSMRQSTYPLELSHPATMEQQDILPPVTLDSQGYGLRYYGNPHVLHTPMAHEHSVSAGHHAQNQQMPVMGLSGAEPYYYY